MDSIGDTGGGQTPGQISDLNDVQSQKQIPWGQNKGSDPVCNGTGWLWQDAYGNRVTCWRCVGTGKIDIYIQNQPNIKINPESEGEAKEGI
jgi:hypothetical protein